MTLMKEMSQRDGAFAREFAEVNFSFRDNQPNGF